ncbi:hypothetical protein INP81_13235 [Comamonas thiooxydans]|uniref:hypothetical protein n=1 Tax=Comamonas thiooxydans TaxID=363952 RepID=UPI0018A6078A|nr:hypothetical protein [Comamonas thiooxydans]QOQ80368.1 hypothetical protein INP81_13235 [Comamonas thiooxydans]
MVDLQAWDGLAHFSQVMKTLLSNIDIDLKPGEDALLESLSMLRSELTILLKVYPIGSTWRIHFRSIIGVKLLDEIDMPEYWHANAEVTPHGSRCAASQVLQGGWSKQLWNESNFGELFYGEVFEILVAGADYCAVVLAQEMPEISELPSST